MKKRGATVGKPDKLKALDSLIQLDDTPPADAFCAMDLQERYKLSRDAARRKLHGLIAQGKVERVEGKFAGGKMYYRVKGESK